MPNRLCPALALVALALVPTSAAGQQERISPLPSYNLVQLSVASVQVAPAEFKAQTAAIRTCTEAMELGKNLNARVERKRFVHLSELPPQLRPVVKGVPTGQATPVLSEDGSILHVLVVCNRA